MIILMKKDSSLANLSLVIRTVEDMGFSPRPYHGALRTVIGVMDGNEADLSGVKDLPGVENVSPLSSKFKLVSKDFQPEPTVVRLGNLKIGGPEFLPLRQVVETIMKRIGVHRVMLSAHPVLLRSLTVLASGR